MTKPKSKRMDRDEAKKMAEEYAETQLAKTTGYTREDLVILRLWAIDSWMACYDAMTKGEADGWCAWHPIMGFDAPTFETERRLIVNRGIESCVDKGASWAVKPVKLIKVEGSSK